MRALARPVADPRRKERAGKPRSEPNQHREASPHPSAQRQQTVSARTGNGRKDHGPSGKARIASALARNSEQSARAPLKIAQQESARRQSDSTTGARTSGVRKRGVRTARPPTAGQTQGPRLGANRQPVHPQLLRLQPARLPPAPHRDPPRDQRLPAPISPAPPHRPRLVLPANRSASQSCSPAPGSPHAARSNA